ncbi:MAG: histidinol-phosphate transaminase [Pseudomonadota bacterium]
MIRPVPTVAAMEAYALADLGPPGAVSLAQNESHLPPSPAALEAGTAALAQGRLYPDPDWTELRAAIAETHGLDPAAILCGAGSMELIGAAIRSHAGPGDAVLRTAHGYPFVATAAQQAGATIQVVPEPGLTVSVDAMLDAGTRGTRLAVLCNPGNPTGTRIPNAEVVRLREALPDTVLLLVDQAYGEFDDQDHRPVFDLLARGDTMVTRSLSKAHALAGARVGWALVPPAIATSMRKLLNPNNVAAASQAMAAASMRDAGHVAHIVAETAALRDATAARLRTLGLDVPEAHANFLLIRFGDAERAARADAALRAAGLILRPAGGLPDALRATIGPPASMDRLVATLEALP